MDIKNSVLDYIRYKQLNWYVNEERLPKKFSNCVHLEDAGSNKWMIKEGINNVEWIDREEWRGKMKIQAQKDVKILIVQT
jgi:hypothetical protein